MIHLIRRLLDFSGKERNALIVSFIFSLLNAIFEMLPIIAILTVLSEMFSTVDGGLMSASTVWKSFVIMLASIAGRIVFSNLSCMKRTIGSFSMCANKRLEIGERLKRIPMGYFSDNRLGDIADYHSGGYRKQRSYSFGKSGRRIYSCHCYWDLAAVL